MNRQGRKERQEIRFLCLVHDDHQPSARYNIEKHVWFCDVCGTGGGAFELARRLGIAQPEQSGTGLTVEELADAKGLPIDFLRALGVTNGWSGSGADRSRCVDIPYMTVDGEVLAIRKRLRLTGEPRCKWRRGDKVMPYGLWRLKDARQAGTVLLVEGETDCWTLWHAGIPALGVPGASTWQPEWATHLEGIAKVFVWKEPDQGGDTLLRRIVA